MKKETINDLTTEKTELKREIGAFGGVSIIAGIMIHISFYELLPTSFKYKKYRLSIIFFIIGSVIMIINHFI